MEGVDLTKAQAKATAYRYTVVQTASSNVSDEVPGNVLGWTDHSVRRCYVFTDRIANLPLSSRAKVARKIAMHEVGHVRWKARSRSIDDMHGWWKLVRRASFSGRTDQSIEEDYCECYSRCNDYQTGVSYTLLSPVPTSTDFKRICPAI